MKKKLLLASVAAVSLGLVTCSVALTQFGTKLGAADPAKEWHHYEALAATTSSVGAKEYWINCTDQTPVFENPGVTCIEEGPVTQQFANKLDLNDSRRVAQLGVIDFEDASQLSLINVEKGTASIVEEDGSHVLKVVESDNVVRLSIVKDYLDKLFANPNVNSIMFDAKASANFNNFRRQTTNKQVTYEYDWAQDTSDPTLTRTGVNTIWKTFCFERAFYDELCDNGGRIVNAEQLTTGAILYFDNFRIDSTTTATLNHLTFDGGTLRTVTASDYRLYGYAKSGVNTVGAWNSDLRIDGACDSVTFDYTIKSQGNRSLKIVRSATSDCSVYIPIEYLTNSSADGYKIDIYFDGSAISRNEINPIQVGNGIVVAPRNMFSGTWITLGIPKENLKAIGTSAPGTDYVRLLKFAGSQCNGTFYIDNLRPYYDTFGFNDNGYGNSNTNAEVGIVNAPASQRKGGENLRDYSDDLFYINGGAVSIEASSDYYTEGTKSAKYVHGSDATFNVYMNKKLFGSNLDAAGISIDLMTKDGHIGKFCGQEVKADGLWHTYTITKADMEALRTTGSKPYWCLAYGTSASAGTYYFDNLVFLNK